MLILFLSYSVMTPEIFLNFNLDTGQPDSTIHSRKIHDISLYILQVHTYLRKATG